MDNSVLLGVILSKVNVSSDLNERDVIDEIKSAFKAQIPLLKDEAEREAMEAAYKGWKDDDFKIEHPFNYTIQCSNQESPKIYTQTLLHFAAWYDCKNVVRALITAGANVDAADKWKNTSLHLAVSNGNKEVVDILLKKQKNTKSLNALNLLGETPLLIAVRKGDIKIVNALIKAGADINKQGEFPNAYTPLHYAAKEGNIDIVNILLRARADVHLQDHNGNTPLHLAAKGGHTKVVNAIISWKGNSIVNLQNNNGDTPLHLAYLGSHRDVINYLLGQQADLLLKNYIGWTPIDCLNNGEAKRLEEAQKAAEKVKKEAQKPIIGGIVGGVVTGILFQSVIGCMLVGTTTLSALAIAGVAVGFGIALGVAVGLTLYFALSPESKIKETQAVPYLADAQVNVV